MLIVCVFQVLNHLHKKLKNMSKKSEASKKKVLFPSVCAPCHCLGLGLFAFFISLTSTQCGKGRRSNAGRGRKVSSGGAAGDRAAAPQVDRGLGGGAACVFWIPSP